jgi:5'-deoxynucleotidase YfbR-like HD superfamily hydrolase
MNKKTLSGIYEFMKKAYQGNWQYRFGDTPFMAAMNSKGKHESILAHQWALMEFWFVLRRECPNLNKVVDSVKIYEMLMNHDLGEIIGGDVSQARQLAGDGVNKVSNEHKAIISLTNSLPTSTSKEIINLFNLYETEIDDVKTVEQLLARFIDYMQGNHFSLTFGKELPRHSLLIGKIVQGWWAKYAKKLISVLKEKGFGKASEEVRQIAIAHMDTIVKAGIKFEFGGFK